MTFENTSFSNQRVDLDNSVFIGCRFEKCNLVYKGGKPPSLVNCSFGEFRISFEGAAADTLSFITALYHGGFKPVIETTFDNIRLNPQQKDWTIH
jgi:hypothetical protein